MPGNNKKTPISNTRKRVTVSVRARVSTKKVKRNGNHNSDGSYLQEQPPETVSTVATGSSTSTVSSNENIVALLQQLNDSNKMLIDRRDKIEQKVPKSPTLPPRSHCDAMPHHTNSTLPQSHVSSIPGNRLDIQGPRAQWAGMRVNFSSLLMNDGATRNQALAGVVPRGQVR